MFLSLDSVLIGILAFIFVLAAIILIHEGGHFFFAVRAGILCREYSFGMGPQLLHTKKGETEYSIRALPIGGFCAIAGEEKEDDILKDKKQVRLVIEDDIIKKICVDVDEELFKDIPLFNLYEYDLFDEAQTGNLFMKVAKPSEDEEGDKIVEYKVDSQACYIYTGKAYKNSNLDFEKKKGKFTKEFQIAPYNRQMNSKSLGKRVMVIFGGPMMNMILAVFAFLVSSLITGVSNVDVTKLSGVSEGSPAYEAGLRDGDIIYGLETVGKDSNVLKNIEIKDWNGISDFMTEYKDNSNYNGEIKIYYYEQGDKALDKTINVKPVTIIYSISMVEDAECEDQVKVAALSDKSKAYKGGIREGDIIKSVNDESVSTWKDVYHAFSKIEKAKQKVKVMVEREGETDLIECTVIPYSKKLFDKTQSVSIVEMQIGISPVVTRNIFKCLGATFKQMWDSIKSMIYTLGFLIFSSEVGLKDMSGVVGIFSMTSDAAQSGFGTLMYWMGFLSVNVGFMNLLPIPALDGGRLVFLAIEGIRKKPVSQKVQDLSINITMYLLYALMIYVIINDVLRLI